MSHEGPKHDPGGPSLWSRIRKGLAEQGIYVGVNEIDDLGDVTLKDFDLSDLDSLRFEIGGEHGGFRVVRVPPEESVDDVDVEDDSEWLPVRLDEATLNQLETWVEMGAFKSRSEAAARFIRQGLAARQEELDKLQKAREDVEAAKERLAKEVGKIFEDEEGSS